MKIGISIKYAGYMRVEVLHAEGSCTDTGWFKNLITNQGLDMLGNWAGNGSIGYIPTHVAVGTSNTAPTITDTQLGNEIAHFPANGSNNPLSAAAYVAGPPTYWSYTGTWTFTQGAVVGNLAEIGFGGMKVGDTVVELMSRSLIKDGSGNPTTLPVTATDILRINYELREYIDTTDHNTTCTISGTTYTNVVRRVAITSPPPGYPYIAFYSAGINRSTSYNGALAAVTAATPTGSSGGFVNCTLTPYVTGTYFMEATASAGISTWNVSGGISVLTIESYKFGNWQVSFSPVIPKDNTKQLTITWHVSWTRY